MRAIIQRVTRAQVSVAGKVIGAIDAGLMVLVGITHSDTEASARKLAQKILHLRIMADEKSVLDSGGQVLVVSQFTLYGDTRKGRRPTWAQAAPGPVAEPLVEVVAQEILSSGVEVQTGEFGADMAVELVNDGPVTLLVEVD